MSDYVVLWGDLSTEAATTLVMALTAVSSGRWTWATKTSSAAVLVRTQRAPITRALPDGRGLLVGEAWTRGGDADLDLPTLLASASLQTQIRALCAGIWGRYVAILADGGGPAIFRDPSGGLEAFAWTRSGLTVIASSLPTDLVDLLAPPMTLDWDRIAGYLAVPTSLSGPLALRGITAVAPGELLQQSGSQSVRASIWRPDAFVADDPEPPAILKGRLVRLTDQVVGALASGRGPLLAEVSGGLDSAIVAAALARRTDVEVKQWLNYYSLGAESDERAYAQALGTLHGFSITSVAKPLRPIDADGLAINAGALRPSLIGLDYLRDADVDERRRCVGANAIFTGQGGDVVFGQRLTALALTDHLRREGLGSLRLGSVRDLADWTGSSAWTVLGQALAGGSRRAPAKEGNGPSFMTDGARRVHVEVHPWRCAQDQTPPGKRQQIERLAQAQLVTGDCRRSREADLIHPLLSQPLVEFCLSIPIDVLTGLKRDRALTRGAFASRLPDALLHRRSKGDMTSHYGQWVSASLPFLRGFLLDGRLAGQGIIDRDRLEAVLTPEQLAWGADYVSILFAAVLEAWVGRWEATCRDLVAPG